MTRNKIYNYCKWLTTKSILPLMFLGLLTSNGILAQAPGSLDTAFGNGGIVTTFLSRNYGNPYMGANAIAIQPDGKSVVTGFTCESYPSCDTILIRYNTDGTLDNSFGTQGKAIASLSPSFEIMTSIAIQSDGKIVVAGYVNHGSQSNLATARFNTDGTLDSNFGEGGKVTTRVNNYNECNAIAVQADGKIILAGSSVRLGDDGFRHFLMVRYDEDGSVDTGFGVGGVVITVINTATITYDGINDLAIQPDGKIIAAGYTGYGSDTAFAIARYNDNGTLDSGFGTGGKRFGDYSSDRFIDRFNALALRPNGKIVVAGDYRVVNSTDFAVTQFNSNGTIDSNFGTNGRTLTPVGNNNDSIRAIAIQPNGKIIAAGYATSIISYPCFTYTCHRNNYALARYNANGTPDSNFGLNGTLVTRILGDSVINALALQDDGKIIAAGNFIKYGVKRKPNYYFKLARYNGNDSFNSTDAASTLTVTRK